MNRVSQAGNPGNFPVAAFRHQRKIKVFIVEDEPVAAQLYMDLLSATPGQFQFHRFSDGDEAWAELTKVDPDILITDIVHPGLDGLEMMKLLAAEKVAYPILIISGDSQPAEFYRNVYPELKLGILGKPFRIPSFYKELCSLLVDCAEFAPGEKTAVRHSNNRGSVVTA